MEKDFLKNLRDEEFLKNEFNGVIDPESDLALLLEVHPEGNPMCEIQVLRVNNSNFPIQTEWLGSIALSRVQALKKEGIFAIRESVISLRISYDKRKNTNFYGDQLKPIEPLQVFLQEDLKDAITKSINKIVQMNK